MHLSGTVSNAGTTLPDLPVYFSPRFVTVRTKKATNSSSQMSEGMDITIALGQLPPGHSPNNYLEKPLPPPPPLPPKSALRLSASPSVKSHEEVPKIRTFPDVHHEGGRWHQDDADWTDKSVWAYDDEDQETVLQLDAAIAHPTVIPSTPRPQSQLVAEGLLITETSPLSKKRRISTKIHQLTGYDLHLDDVNVRDDIGISLTSNGGSSLYSDVSATDTASDPGEVFARDSLEFEIADSSSWTSSYKDPWEPEPHTSVRVRPGSSEKPLDQTNHALFDQESLPRDGQFPDDWHESTFASDLYHEIAAQLAASDRKSDEGLLQQQDSRLATLKKRISFSLIADQSKRRMAPLPLNQRRFRQSAYNPNPDRTLYRVQSAFEEDEDEHGEGGVTGALTKVLNRLGNERPVFQDALFVIAKPRGVDSPDTPSTSGSMLQRANELVDTARTGFRNMTDRKGKRSSVWASDIRRAIPEESAI